MIRIEPWRRLKPAMPTTSEPKLWRDLAAKARALSRRLEDPAKQKRLEEIAKRYDILAEISDILAEISSRTITPPPPKKKALKKKKKRRTK
jgi:hypothetical protein